MTAQPSSSRAHQAIRDPSVLDCLDLRIDPGSSPCSARTAPARRPCPHPATLVQPDAGTARVLGHDVVARAARGPAPDRCHRSVRRGRRAADRRGEPRAGRPAARACRRPRPGAGRRAAGAVRPHRRRARRVATYSGGMRRRLDLAMTLVSTPRCCSWTSRPPGWTPAAGRRCGTRSALSPPRGHRAAHHPVPGGGRRARRPDRRPRRRPGGRRRHPGRAEAQVGGGLVQVHGADGRSSGMPPTDGTAADDRPGRRPALPSGGPGSPYAGDQSGRRLPPAHRPLERGRGRPARPRASAMSASSTVPATSGVFVGRSLRHSLRDAEVLIMGDLAAGAC